MCREESIPHAGRKDRLFANGLNRSRGIGANLQSPRSKFYRRIFVFEKRGIGPRLSTGERHGTINSTRQPTWSMHDRRYAHA